MRSVLFVAVATAGLAASAFAGGIPTNFGTLTDSEGSEISFDAGTGNSNTNFMYQNVSAFQDYTVGLSAQTYYGSANGPVTNNGVDTFYVQAGADQSGNPSAGAGAGRWSFKWSITDDWSSGGVPDYVKMALRIDGPSGGSWGSIDSAYAAPVTGYPGSGTEYANQQVWGTYYDFMQLNSADSGAPAGVWDGLAYDFDEVGTYTIQLRVWEDVKGPIELTTMTMYIEVQGSTPVVPGVGGIAALGGLGLVGRRRRR